MELILLQKINFRCEIWSMYFGLPRVIYVLRALSQVSAG